MIRLKVRVTDKTKELAAKVKDATFRSLDHAAGAVRLTARRSIKRNAKPSATGTAPHTRRGALKEAIAYAVDKQAEYAVIGPDFQDVGPSGQPHEFSGEFRGQSYPKRPFMGPALDKNRSKLPDIWSGSVR